jgi:hypothetical protein
MDEKSPVARLRSAAAVFLKRLLLVMLVAGLVIFAVLYWGVYERGVMAGRVLRVTQKGVLFKTYEGKLSLESFGALKNVSPISETFDFSVEKGETAVISDLQEVALTGERVNLHFKKRYLKFPWRGETRYFVTRVERSKDRP